MLLILIHLVLKEKLNYMKKILMITLFIFSSQSLANWTGSTKILSMYHVNDDQVILNLVGNAIKFTIQGSIVLKVKPVHQKNGMERISFEVKDTGIGIPMQKQDFVFENFTQLEDHRTRTVSGTGLGLGIAKSLVEAVAEPLERCRIRDRLDDWQRVIADGRPTE